MSQDNIDSSIILPILQRIPIFRELNDKLHNKIIQRIVLMYYPKDYSLFEKGDEGDALYIIKSGQVQIFKPSEEIEDMQKEVAVLGAGGFFGEMSLISSDKRNASAKTLEESEIFLLSRRDFNKLLETDINLAEMISTTVIDRTKENNEITL